MPELNRYLVKAAVNGVPEADAAAGAIHLRHELSMRPHLERSQVSWDMHSKAIIVLTETQDLEAAAAADQVAEELFEVACAILPSVDGMRVTVLDVRSASL